MPELIQVHADEICIPPATGPAVVTVGTFDGVHRGHQEILRRMNSAARKNEVRTVVTFEPHPQSVIRREGHTVRILTDTREKIRLLCAGGISRTYILQFDQHLAGISAEDFVQQILLKRLQTTRLVVGYNHSFGHNREGNFEFLEKNQKRFGFELEVVGPYYLGGEVVSSTKIRRALEGGNVEKATLYLGRPYALSGKVVHGAGRGRKLEVPTANLELPNPDKLIPKIGVYAVEVTLGAVPYPGMLAIGIRPTFNESPLTVEVHLIDFQGDLYDQTLEVRFLKWLRDEERYASTEALKTQMSKDRQASLHAYKAYQRNPTA
ncbi:MAG TPA: bifunctional riboflavin kinase/FAD synthetase [bacterium]